MRETSKSSSARPGDAIEAHALADDREMRRLRSLSLQQRAQMLEAACAAAAELERSRVAAGMPAAQPVPWPASTWEFLRRHATHARG